MYSSRLSFFSKYESIFKIKVLRTLNLPIIGGILNSTGMLSLFILLRSTANELILDL